MILADSSVWIAHLRGNRTAATEKLRTLAAEDFFLVGDLILLEVLQGARDDAHAVKIEAALRRFEIVPLLDAGLAPLVARNYRRLRSTGVTVRKTADLIIATWCIEHDVALLHDDRDFAPMVERLGLVVV